MWALVGYGPNDVEIPALVWTNKEQALADCKEIFGEDPQEDEEGNFYWNHEEDRNAIKKMYKSYYGGCGECYSAGLIEIQEGKPFVKWNLD